jgi:hypothetical protein
MLEDERINVAGVMGLRNDRRGKVGIKEEVDVAIFQSKNMPEILQVDKLIKEGNYKVRHLNFFYFFKTS